MPVYYKCININYRIFPVSTLTNKRVCYCHASEMLVHGNCMYTFLQDIKWYDVSVYHIQNSDNFITLTIRRLRFEKKVNRILCKDNAWIKLQAYQRRNVKI